MSEISVEATRLIDEFEYAVEDAVSDYTMAGGASYKNQARYNLEDYIAEMEEAQRWIPVSERLPLGETVLALWKDKTIHLDWTFIDGGSYYWWNSGQANVTHWMPLPQPPEVQE